MPRCLMGCASDVVERESSGAPADSAGMAIVNAVNLVAIHNIFFVEAIVTAFTSILRVITQL